MKTSVMKKSLLDYAIKGFLSTKFRKDNPSLNALSEIESYNASILKDKRAKEKALKTLESNLKNEKDKEAKQNLKSQMTALKKEITKLKIITPLESPNTFTLPFEIPESWVWVRLGEVCEIVLGKTPKREIIEYWNPNDYHWVSIGDMLERETITNTKECISQKARQDCFGDSITPKGTLLLSFKLTIGKTSFLGFDGFYNEGIVSIIPKIYRDVSVLPQHEKANYHSEALAEESQKDTIFKNFLLYFLPIFTNLCEKTGAIKGETLNKEKLIHLPIPLPPLQEQKQIVQILDQLMDLANEFERTQENLKRIEKRIEKSLLKFAIQGNLSKCYRKDNPSLNALSEIESYNASILKDKRAKEKALKTLESNLKNEKDKEAKQNLKSQITALKKEITKLKIITPLICHSKQSEESIQSHHTNPPTPTKSIENANFQNTFTPPFAIPESWAWVRLGDICEIINGISIVGIQLPALDVKYLRTKTNKIVLNGGNMVNINDRIILMDGENSGEVFVVKEKGFLGSTLKKLNFSKVVKIEFMDYLLFFYKDLLKGNKKGAAIPHLDRHLFLNLQIALPPMQEQKEIVKVLDSLFTLTKGLRVE